jgi:hypothetical protein
MNREQLLRQRLRLFTWLFIIGRVLTGATAIPLVSEVDWLAKNTSARVLVEAPGPSGPAGWALWLTRVQNALHATSIEHPFLFYGTDWLAFGHFAIALAFIGALRDPVRNSWLFTFGILACILVIPYSFMFGAIRGIPVWWRLIDCSFGVFGIIPVWLCKSWADELEQAGSQMGAATEPMEISSS